MEYLNKGWDFEKAARNWRDSQTKW